MPNARRAFLYPSAKSHKNNQHDTALKASTLEMLDQDYNTSVWTHVYTDGSSDAAVRIAGSGSTSASAMAKHVQGRWLRVRCQATSEPKLLVVLDAARLLSTETPTLSLIVISLADCKSAVQSLQSPREQLERDTQRLLCGLSQHSKVAVQWIPAHCGLPQETRRQMVLQSLAANKSSPTWKSLMERPKL